MAFFRRGNPSSQAARKGGLIAQMKTKQPQSQGRYVSTLISLLLATSTPVTGFAQTPAAPAAATAAATSAQAPLKAEQLEQLLSPIALYPDALLAQVLMASTYPLEIVQAARWLKANPGKTGKALEDAMQGQAWDASVKSLVAVHQVLEMLNEKLEWAQQLGDAFLAQREDVMEAVQRLRAKASAAGKLKPTKEQKVVTQKEANKTVIVIEPTNPQVVYVPVYNPAVVYGAWPYPAYPPYPYYPFGYVAGAAFAFTAGVAVGAALWGGCNWGRNDIHINVNRYNSFNRTKISNTNWQHNAAHRKGVPYRDAGVAQQFGRGQASPASREAFRGRTEADLGKMGRGGSSLGDRSRDGARPGSGAGDRANLDRGRVGGDRSGGGRTGGSTSRPTSMPASVGRGGGRDSAFANIDRGAATRANADRGRASLGGGAGRGGGAGPSLRGGGRGGGAGLGGGRGRR
jgi:hypothetical protein